MAPRGSKYGFPTGVPPRSSLTLQSMDLSMGLTLTSSYANLQPGQASSTSNMEFRDGGMMRRSGFTAAHGDSVPKIALTSLTSFNHLELRGAIYTDRYDGQDFVFLTSDTTAFVLDNYNAISVLSYTSSLGTSVPYSLSTNPFAQARPAQEFVQAYDLTSDRDAMVWTINDIGQEVYPPYAWFSASTTTYTHLTDDVRGRAIALHDNRLFLWNSRYSSDSTVYPNRVIWSDRGDIRAFDPSANTVTAGYEDLLDMGGYGTKIVSYNERLLLFSDREIWQGNQAAPPYQYQFVPLYRQVGARHQDTVVKTPVGVMFFGNDGRVYVITPDNQLRWVSQSVDQEIRELGNGPSIRAAYDPQERSYKLCDGQIGEYWAVNIDTLVWNHGFIEPVNQYEIRHMFSGEQDRFNAVADLPYGNYGAQTLFVTSGATVWKTCGDITEDVGYDPSGDTVTADWTGPILTGPLNRAVTIRAVGIDYRSEVASQVTVSLSLDGGASFPVTTGVSLSTTSSFAESRATAWLYGTSGSPMLKLQTSGASQHLLRLHVEGIIQGR